MFYASQALQLLRANSKPPSDDVFKAAVRSQESLIFWALWNQLRFAFYLAFADTLLVDAFSHSASSSFFGIHDVWNSNLTAARGNFCLLPSCTNVIHGFLSRPTVEL
ncbi:hypothetical protein BASA60_001596 [Batrachochytrium salamandrivorans]|nr:hypothetical protein BASA60_001596 [Batrachochytrium salamandrivorans]